jgi:DMSO/TMAO reductase YedYZ molybdopterin-dependent catalytic subunit
MDAARLSRLITALDASTHPPSRREFLTDAVVAGSALLLGSSHELLAQAPASIRQGKLVRTIRFRGSRRFLEKIVGTGWHGRLSKDLSKLSEKTLITPNDKFYIRTRCPLNLPKAVNWKISLRDQERAAGQVAAKDLAKRAKPKGVHLLECSGNGGSFGLISAAEWSGVPILEVLDDAGLKGENILVRGFDEHKKMPKQAMQSGCSWIFKREQLAKSGAFLATEMNGHPLPVDHGYPVRLLVPGWYGCTCVKWVRSIEIVDAKAKSTRHMREYARRTQQKGTPRRAKDFRPAEMDTAAIPIRVEEWKEGKETVFKVIGLVWGGDKVVSGLDIHIGDEPVVPVSSFAQKTHTTWSLWSHEWKPTREGRFDIWLTVRDKKVRTRRLDRRYYKRRIEI